MHIVTKSVVRIDRDAEDEQFNVLLRERLIISSPSPFQAVIAAIRAQDFPLITMKGSSK